PTRWLQLDFVFHFGLCPRFFLKLPLWSLTQAQKNDVKGNLSSSLD
uniref:Uncharacterized protein n=1 Tax=Amphimedon queenslandica TaxID=400682 RepID=A0A1X7UA84_AMPQE